MTKRAVQYARASTDMQDQSVDDQLKATSLYANDHGYDIVRTPFVDDGISGVLTKDRHAFMRLMDLVQHGKPDFQYILTYDMSRWGRFLDEAEQGYWDFILHQAGIDVIYTHDLFSPGNSPESNILKGIQRSNASNMPKKLSLDVTRGLKSLVKAGYWPGEAPYAYVRCEVDEYGKKWKTLVKGERKNFPHHNIKLVPGNKSEVKTVKSIFTWSKQGVGEITIANKLNSANVPSPSGGKWGISTIQKILTNPAYTGTTVWGRRKGGKFTYYLNSWGDSNPGGRMHDKDKWITCEHTHEPLIDDATFKQVRKNLEKHSFIKNPGQGRTYGSQFLLTSLIYCKNCGAKYGGRSYHRRRRKKAYLCYRCGTRAKKGQVACDARTVNREHLDHFAIDRIIDELTEVNFWPHVEKSLRDKLEKGYRIKRDEEFIKREIAKAKISIDKLLDLIEHGNSGNRQLYDDRLSKNREEMEKLEDELASLKSTRDSIASVETIIKKAKKEFSNPSKLLSDSVFGDHEANELKKKIIKEFLYKVVVDSDQMKVDFYFYKIPRISQNLPPVHEDRSGSLSASRASRGVGVG